MRVKKLEWKDLTIKVTPCPGLHCKVYVTVTSCAICNRTFWYKGGWSASGEQIARVLNVMQNNLEFIVKSVGPFILIERDGLGREYLSI